MALLGFKFDPKNLSVFQVVDKKGEHVFLNLSGKCFTDIVMDKYQKWTIGINLDETSALTLKPFKPFKKIPELSDFTVRNPTRVFEPTKTESIYLKLKLYGDEFAAEVSGTEGCMAPNDLTPVNGTNVKFRVAVSGYVDPKNKVCGLYFVPQSVSCTN